MLPSCSNLRQEELCCLWSPSPCNQKQRWGSASWHPLCSIPTPQNSFPNKPQIFSTKDWKANHVNLWDRKRFCSWADSSRCLVLIGWSFVVMMSKPVKQMLQIVPFWFMNVGTSLCACYRRMQSFTVFVSQRGVQVAWGGACVCVCGFFHLLFVL